MRQVLTDDNHCLSSSSPRFWWRGSLPLLAAFSLLASLAAGIPEAQAQRARGSVAEGGEGEAGSKAPLPERLIEKRVGARNFRLTLQPGDLQEGKVAVATVEIQRVLDIPDPVTGRTRPLQELEPVAELSPSLELRRTRNAPKTVLAKMWPASDPGTYAFHFTPEADGVYTLEIRANEPGEDGSPRPFDVNFRLGVGSAVAETEQGSGTGASRRGGRRPVGPGVRQQSLRAQLQSLMEEVGEAYLALHSSVEGLPARGAVPKARRDALAKDARELGELLKKTAGTVPVGHKSSADEYDQLVNEAVLTLEGLASTAETQTTAAASSAAFRQVQAVGCLKCHAKYRWNVADDLNEDGWPWPQPSAKAE